MFSFLPLSVLNWYLPLTLQRAGNFAHCNLSVGEHEYLFIVCICPLCLLPLSPSVCQTSHFLSFLFHLPLHCYLAFSFVRVYICTYQRVLYRTGRYVIRPSINMEILKSHLCLDKCLWSKLRLVCHYTHASSKVHVKLNIIMYWHSFFFKGGVLSVLGFTYLSEDFCRGISTRSMLHLCCLRKCGSADRHL